MRLFIGQAPAPAAYYSEIATAARAIGQNIQDDDFDAIDEMLGRKEEGATIDEVQIAPTFFPAMFN